MNAQQLFWSSNLKILRNRKHITQEDLAQQIGIARVKLHSLESGKTVNPSLQDLLNFSAYFKIGVDTMLKVDLSTMSELSIRELEAGNDAYTMGTKLRVLATTVDKDNKENLEYVPVKAKAGYVAGYNDPAYISTLPKFTLPNLAKEGTYRMFPTTGASMLPIPENSLVIGKFVQDWHSIKDDTLCILILKSMGHDFVFKLVKNHIRQTGTVELHSLNPEYKPYSVDVTDILEIWKFEQYVSSTVPAGNITMDMIATTLRDIKVDVGNIARKIR